MYIRLRIFWCIFLISPVIFSQENSTIQTDREYYKFKSTLDKETAFSDTIAVDPARSALHPASIPEWFSALPSSDSQTLCIVGISDPGMEESKAFRLARLRAQVLSALMIHPQVISMTDNYANEQPDVNAEEFATKYENLYKIESSIIAPVKGFYIVDSCYTSFGEAIVLAKCNLSFIESADTQKISISIDSYQVERQKQNRFEKEERLEISGSWQSPPDTISGDIFNYSCISLNNLFEIESEFNDEAIQQPFYYFRYSMNADSLNKDIPSNGNSKLNYGLWKAYLEQVVQKVILLSQPFIVNVRQVGDHHTEKNQTLSREIYETSPSFYLKNLYINNNYIIVDMDYLIKPN